MRRREFLGAVLAGAAPAPDYLKYVQGFARTMLEKGRDVYGTRHTPLWAGVMDARTLAVPEKDVPPPKGVRPADRAVGGANLYHDCVTLKVFRALSAVTGNPAYEEAAREYARAYLALAAHPETGLLAWGEHLYYDFFRDQVAAERRSHELLEWSPPWEELWREDPRATRRAIAGIRYHFYADDPWSLFNRHAGWAAPAHQKPGGQPWIKHSGLYAYSFLFLYAKTKEQVWLDWARGAGALYWNRRHPETGLTLGCIDDPRPGSRAASTQMPELAYWLLKGWQQGPAIPELRERARALLAAYFDYFCDRERNVFLARLNLAGEVQSEETVPPWNIAYGSPGILPNGRIAAYFARTETDPRFLEMARRTAEAARDAPLPPDVSVEGVAFALNLNLDLFDLTRERRWLTESRRYADFAIQMFWIPNPAGGLFVRSPGDGYYEAKVGVGDLLAGLLRLHLRLNPRLKDPGVYDWSY